MWKLVISFSDFLSFIFFIKNGCNDLGVNITVNKTRFKLMLLDNFSGKCQEQSDGRSILIVFNEGMK